MSGDCIHDAAPLHQAGDELHGFLVERVTRLPALRAIAYELRHQCTGAAVLHVHANDSENLFAISFRTPPPDSTGLPHILEHSVLGGSHKYPVKDPFVEMLKSSMATFINAMTYPDRTVYPVASNVRKDFFNLADVYCDAVFHPNITPMTLKQEGHHLAFSEAGNTDSSLTVQGIVYNEMKGAYSDLDSVIDRDSTQGLFPDTPYGVDSGGMPEAIPDLTYDVFVRFHRDYYHPANAQIFLYGDIPTADQLLFLDSRLRTDTQAPQVDTALPRHLPWLEPRDRDERVPLGPDEAPLGQSAVTLNWLVGDAADEQTELALEVLEKILFGSAAAPLRKALVDSHMGEDLTASGYSAGLLQGTFHVGLKGIAPERQDEMVELVMRTLRGLVEKGVSAEMMDAAFHQVEYGYREIESSYPLHLMERVYSAWNFDVDPLTYLRADTHLDDLYQLCGSDPAFFGRLIREKLIDNPHRLTLRFIPDRELQDRRDREQAAYMEGMKSALSPAQLADLDQEAAELAAIQGTPNSAEALATLPQLRLADIPPVPKRLPSDAFETSEGVPFVRPHVHANGVNYLLLAFDLTGLPFDLLPYVQVFASLLNQVGTTRHNYATMAERIAACTGGFSAGTFVSADAVDPGASLRYLTVSLKAVDRTYEAALEVMREVLLDFTMADRARLNDVLTQRKVRLASSVVRNGHRYAGAYAGRTVSEVARASEALMGISQVRLAGKLATAQSGCLDGLVGKVEAIRRHILTRGCVNLSFTGTDALLARTQSWLDDIVTGLPEPGAGATPAGIAPTGTPLSEGLVATADVAYCALCMAAPHGSDPDSPLLGVFSQLLSYDYLWEEVRAKGGAYGGSCNYDPSAQVFELLSYRDPNVSRTIETYHRTIDYLNTVSWTAREIERAVIGCARTDERPIRPGMATATALWRHLAHLTEDLREQRHRVLLSATPEAVRAVALRCLEPGLQQSNVCVLSSRSRLEAANVDLAQPLALEVALPG
ncbi:MAG: hypothetical protein HN742_29990 [Lentisphaerae bacterium]|jgi:presequence protease|nr:hypothetical protein [Lentisphaerota bacterium]MBT5608268.1 hypothetical protein [Lentisphaerota bacterium]MBT7061832.1 hypothetical protein [Lentisphaerota bacterium]MBT7846141.1 hypothetical protein [Lentisphaerota bacterium]